MRATREEPSARTCAYLDSRGASACPSSTRSFPPSRRPRARRPATGRAETDPATRIEARRRLFVALTAHANAEESVLYPALARFGEKRHASMAYAEHAAAKTQLGALETLDPAGEDYLDKLETIRSAVAHHMYEEEGTWAAELKRKAGAEEQARLTRRFEEEYRRYAGGGGETIASRH